MFTGKSGYFIYKYNKLLPRGDRLIFPLFNMLDKHNWLSFVTLTQPIKGAIKVKLSYIFIIFIVIFWIVFLIY